MNQIQINTFKYLTKDDASEERASALEQLSDEGFFTRSSEGESIEHLTSFIDDCRSDGTFCNSGIDRFEQNLLPVVQKPVDTRYSATLQFTVAGGAVGHEKANEIKATIALLADVKDVTISNLAVR